MSPEERALVREVDDLHRQRRDHAAEYRRGLRDLAKAASRFERQLRATKKAEIRTRDRLGEVAWARHEPAIAAAVRPVNERLSEAMAAQTRAEELFAAERAEFARAIAAKQRLLDALRSQQGR